MNESLALNSSSFRVAAFLLLLQGCVVCDYQPCGAYWKASVVFAGVAAPLKLIITKPGSYTLRYNLRKRDKQQ
jgi:hypothetical protein